MKRIGIDARLLSQTGVGVYVSNLLHQLCQQKTKDIAFFVYVLPEDASFLTQIIGDDLRFTMRITRARWHSISEQILFLWQLLSDNLDLFHATYFSYPVLYPKPFVATVHDLTPLLFKTGRASTRHPFFYYLKHAAFCFVLKAQLFGARRIFTPSNAVALALQTRFSIPEKTIVVTHEGVSQGLIASESRKPKTIQDQPYFLYVGNCYPHKNIETLLMAYQKYRGSNAQQGVKLILRSPEDHFTKRVRDITHQLQIEDDVLILNHFELSELRWLYENAVCVILPSFSEGFGLPVLEALYFNAPLLVSDIPVFHEIAGEKAHYFDPNDPSILAISMSEVSQNVRGKSKLPNQSILSKFSFEKMTQLTVKTYNEVLEAL